MACRRIISNFGGIATARPIASLSVALNQRPYSSDSKEDELRVVTHTGQVRIGDVMQTLFDCWYWNRS